MQDSPHTWTELFNFFQHLERITSCLSARGKTAPQPSHVSQREKHPTFALGLLRSDLVPASFQSVAVFENGIERHWNEDGGPNERNENEEGADCGSFRPPSTLFDPRSLELWSVRPRFCHYMERFILSFRTHSETKWSRNEIFIVLESFHRYDYAMHCIMKWHPNEDRMTPKWYKNENGQNYHFQACRQWSPRVAKGRQVSPRFKGDPMDGWDELKPDRSYLSHFPPWYSKSGHFPIEIPIKMRSYRSISVMGL